MADHADEADEANQICHVVNFVLDESATTTELTVRVRGKWFHISLCPRDISMKELQTNYKRLFRAASRQKKLGEAQLRRESVENENDKEDKAKDNTKKSVDSAGSVVDSGYASEEAQEPEEGQDLAGEDGTLDAEQDLQNWLLAPFGSIFEELSPKDKQAKQPTLTEWFHTEIFFFSLYATKEAEKLQPRQEYDQDGEQFICRNLIPHMTLPKYLRSLSKVPWVSPLNIHVLSESDEPNPVHPAVVRFTKNDGSEETTHFLKLVASEQEPAIKREINLLQEISKRKLYDQGLRAPRLEGLVSDVRNPNSQTQILGFLITAIPSPTPLTHLIDSSVHQSKREQWAKESQDMVAILHKNDIIWGDAKADNFVVDVQEKLWMIDFGGSYTEGWVDPELMETKEGDNMGVEKIDKALKNPDENSFDPEEEGLDGDNGEVISGSGVEEAVVEERERGEQSRKRKRSQDKGKFKTSMNHNEGVRMTAGSQEKKSRKVLDA